MEESAENDGVVRPTHKQGQPYAFWVTPFGLHPDTPNVMEAISHKLAGLKMTDSGFINCKGCDILQKRQIQQMFLVICWVTSLKMNL
jgi:hypothetical protein